MKKVVNNVVPMLPAEKSVLALHSYRFKRVVDGSRAIIVEKEKLCDAVTHSVIELEEVDFSEGDSFSVVKTGRKLKAVIMHLGFSWPGVANGFVVVEFELVG